MKKILVVHGPNLNLLGQREKDIYGDTALEEINRRIKALADDHHVETVFFQSNHEGEIVDRIGRAKADGFAAIVMNPAAYTHTSVAIRDAVLAVALPTVEVHLSNIYAREDFRHQSLIAPVCVGQVSGFGIQSYLLALRAAIGILENQS